LNPPRLPVFDLQINGWQGVDFNDRQLTAEQLLQVCQQLAARGVQRFLATLITDHLPAMLQQTRHLARLIDADPLIARMIAGIHLEGPFLNPESGYIGAHQPSCVLSASPDVAAQFYEAAAGKLLLVTLAPESDMDGRTIRFLAERGVRVAAGHCNPSLEQLQAAMDSGLTMFTHLGNACPIQLPRHDNIIQRALSLSDRLFVTFIADGHHIPFLALGNYLRIVGPERAILVSDVTSAGGLPPGPFQLNRRPVRIDEQGVARLVDQPQLLAGSTCLLDQAIELLQERLGLTMDCLRQLVWTNPHRALGQPEGQPAALFPDPSHPFVCPRA
jgi:N-acetylglucosamine-6-phosphate deacetylase